MQHYAEVLANWAPVVGRVILGLIFVHSSLYKIPGTEMFAFQVDTSAAAGIPLPTIAVTLAFLLELFGGIALVLGWFTRLISALFIGFIILIALFFARGFLADQMQMMIFFSCLQLIAALLYIYAFGPGKYSIDNRKRAAVEGISATV